MRAGLAGVLAVAPLCSSWSGAAAQGIEGIEATVGRYGWAGDNVEGAEAGPRLQLVLYGSATPWLDIGLAGTWGRGGFEGVDESYNEWGLGANARASFGAQDRPHLIAGAYVGWTQISVSREPTSADIEENGIAVGPHVGLAIPLVAGPELTLVGEVLWQRYDEIRISSGPGLAVGGDAGWRFGGKVGIRFGPGL